MAKIPSGGKSVGSIPKSILYNRYLLYFIFAVTIGNIVQLMSQQDHMSVVIMVIVGLLTSFFSKNMVVIMCIALVVTNLLKYGTRLRSEGFKTMDGEEEEEEEDDDNEEEDEEEDDDDKEADDKEVEADQEADLVLEEKKESFKRRKGKQ
tara:strand:+ start:1812 stop:2261 length:450 start_codon:yes stop_codon:yes gene_type:complete